MTTQKIELTDEQWREKLTPEQYEVLRRHGDRARVHRPVLERHHTGTYRRAACGQLFPSAAKFDSGTGWPSYTGPMAPGSVGAPGLKLRDGAHRGDVRRCGGHLGHVFDDGPRPTGLRYCMNSRALDLEPDA